MTKVKRIETYDKYGHRCAYCGKPIEFKDMQVDHLTPQRMLYGIDRQHADCSENLMPSCRRCNHYKRAHSLERFRELLLTLHERVREIYICKVAEDYGIIEVKPWDGKFYYEKVER